MEEVKKIPLDELKKIELNILTEIHKICSENNIRYSLAGGTLLGAVRHGGFIPWDDDIDIFMPRPDYNAFIEYCKKNTTPFKLICHELTKKYNYLFAKAVDPSTIIKERNGSRTNLELGVFVDIFPIDSLGDTLENAKKGFNKTTFKRELLVAYNWKKFFRSKTRSIIYEPLRFAMFLLSRFTNPKKLINKIEKVYYINDFIGGKYAGAVCGSYRLKEILPIEIYSNYESIIFEGRTFLAIKDKEKYLSNIYGDYMKLPPVEKQVTHHTFDAYYK